jgi:S1-C subfamily serine protease
VRPTRDERMLVRQVVPGSTAARAGLRRGDQLKSVGDVEVTNRNWGRDLRSAYSESPEAPVTVVYIRGGEEVSKQVTLATRTRYVHRLRASPDAGEAELELRRGILEGAGSPGS